jgi:hypothetical protein
MKIEKDGDGRWTVRDDSGSRMGVVLGSPGRYQAQTMRGTLVGQAPTMDKAIALLVKQRKKA